jgi:hypothetical protein
MAASNEECNSPRATLTITTTAPSSYFPVFEPHVPNFRILILWLGLILARGYGDFRPELRKEARLCHLRHARC